MKKDGIKEKSFFLFLLLLQALLMAAALIYCRARYEVSDDFVMELILTGAFDGQPDPHMMFSSFLWGKLLLVFMKIFAGVNWYLAGQMLTVFLTFVCLSVFLVRRKNWAAAVFFLSVRSSAFLCFSLVCQPWGNSAGSGSERGQSCPLY